jgi:hypothetical protein
VALAIFDWPSLRYLEIEWKLDRAEIEADKDTNLMEFIDGKVMRTNGE